LQNAGLQIGFKYFGEEAENFEPHRDILAARERIGKCIPEWAAVLTLLLKKW
jgi:hypothetical protein